VLVDDREHGLPFERVGEDLALGVEHLVDVHHGAEQAVAVGKVHVDALRLGRLAVFFGGTVLLRAVVLRAVRAGGLGDLLGRLLRFELADALVKRLRDGAALALVVGAGLVENPVRQPVLAELRHLLAADLEVEREGAQDLLAHPLEVALRVVAAHDVVDLLLEHPQNLAVEALAGQGLPAPGVDNLALRVEHVVVFELALAHREVVLFDLALRPADRLVHPRVCDDFALLDAEAVHDLRHALRSEQAH